MKSSHFADGYPVNRVSLKIIFLCSYSIAELAGAMMVSMHVQRIGARDLQYGSGTPEFCELEMPPPDFEHSLNVKKTQAIRRAKFVATSIEITGTLLLESERR